MVFFLYVAVRVTCLIVMFANWRLRTRQWYQYLRFISNGDIIVSFSFNHMWFAKISLVPHDIRYSWHNTFASLVHWMKYNLDRVVYFLVKRNHRFRNSVTELNIAKLTSCYINDSPDDSHFYIFCIFTISIKGDNEKKKQLLFTLVYVANASLKFQRYFNTALCFHSWWAVA